MLIGKRKTLGLSMVELMIGLFIGTLVIAGVIYLFFFSSKHSEETYSSARLDSQLQLVLETMARDLQRAGYWASAETSSTNPFMVSGSTDISINAGNNCILFTYDANNNGSLEAISSSIDDERYGFRLNSEAIQYRPRGAAFTCTAASNLWQNLTDVSIVKITQFQITLNTEVVDLDDTGPGTATIAVRSVTISITGELQNDPTVTQSLQKTVKLYNDKFTP